MTAAPNPSSPAVGRHRGRYQLVLIVLAFFVPVAAAWLIFFFGPPVTPDEAGANGTLIHPARPLPEEALVDAAGQPVSDAPLRERWTILYYRPEGCGAECVARLADMHQIRLALGEEMLRVQTGVLLEPAALDAFSPAALPAAVRVFTLQDPAAMERLRPRFATPVDDADLFLVDPLGNVMMFYRAGGDPKAVLRDLRHLLKASRIG